MFSVISYSAKTINGYKNNTNFLYDFYLPIVGCTATSFYMLLANNVSYSNKNNNLSFSYEVAARTLNCSIQELDIARQKLEATGLISTYISTENKNFLCFVLNSPLNFEEFFLNNKYKTLLLKQIGSVGFEYLQYKYSNDNNLKNFVDVSSSFVNVFNDESLDQVKVLDFSIIYADLQKIISLPLIIDDECKQIIENIYLRHNVSIKKIEEIIADSIDCINNSCNVSQNLLVFNINQFLNNSQKDVLYINLSRNFGIFTGTIDLEKRTDIINEYKTINSYNYLSSIFKRPLKDNEKKIISNLKNKYFLSDELINVIVDFSLFKTNGNFNQAYVYKTANTINGLNIKNSVDTIEYFKKSLLVGKAINNKYASSMKDIKDL